MVRVPRYILLLALLCLGFRATPNHVQTETKLWLWAWERREDLRFLERATGTDVGVAFLARTVSLGPRGLTVVPRRQPLLLPEGMAPKAVVRLTLPEGYLAGREPLTTSEMTELVGAIVAPLGEAPTAGLQLDFDARASEETFRKELLRAIHAELRVRYLEVPFGTTALAARCMHDAQNSDPAEGEVVPMLFSLGPDAVNVRLGLQAWGDFPAARCRDAIGIMVGDAVPDFARGRTVYAFSRGPWTAASFETVRRATSPSPP